MSGYSNKRNWLCIFFFLPLFGMLNFVERRPKRMLMRNPTYKENNQEMFPRTSERSSTPPCKHWTCLWVLFWYFVCLRRLPVSLIGLLTHSRHGLYLNEVIKLPWVVLKDHSNNLQHYHINATFAAFTAVNSVWLFVHRKTQLPPMGCHSALTRDQWIKQTWIVLHDWCVIM